MFGERVFYLHQEEVVVSRPSQDIKPDTHNAIFDCKVRNIYN